MLNICQTIDQIRDLVKKVKLQNKIISLVPTMGSLHHGHLELIKNAKKESDFVIVSIFVNEKQFNQSEDYQKYPRNLDQDLEKLREYGVDAVFTPANHEIYPENNIINININQIDKILCGQDRAGHFNAVALIIIKLFAIITPDIAIFGLKDFQQFFIIKKLVRQLNLNVQIKGIETIREESGLALSSRNVRLAESNQIIAANIFKILNEVRSEILQDNDTNITTLLEKYSQKLSSLGIEEIIYFEIRDIDNLELCQKFDIKKQYRLFICVIIAGVRLIDNISI